MLQSKAWRSPASRLVDTHWKLIKRLTKDEDEAHELAVRLLEKFDQFEPNHAFAQFIRLKLRELRQHYSDKGVVGHSTRKEAGGYVSFDKSRGLRDDEESGTLYDFEPANPSQRFDINYLSEREQRICQAICGGHTQREIAKQEGISPSRVHQILRAVGVRTKIEEVTVSRHGYFIHEWVHALAFGGLTGDAETIIDDGPGESGRRDNPRTDEGYDKVAARVFPTDVPLSSGYLVRRRHRAYCEKFNSLGYAPEPAKLRRRRKRVSPEALRRERKAEAEYAPRVKARIYFGERITGFLPLPRDRLWEKSDSIKSAPESLSEPMSCRRWFELMESETARQHELRLVHGAHACLDYINEGALADVLQIKIPRRAAKGPWNGERTLWWKWHRYSSGDNQWEGLAYVRAYLARNGMAQRGVRRWHETPMAWGPYLFLRRWVQCQHLRPGRHKRVEIVELDDPYARESWCPYRMRLWFERFIEKI